MSVADSGPAPPAPQPRGVALDELRAKRDAGRKLLVTYVTGGLRDDWVAVLDAMVAAGADLVEVGLPFSDPVMDGPTIQEASAASLARGTNPHGLRHQGITRALDLAHGDVRKVKRFSRHAKLETLLRYDDNRRDEAGAIAKLLGEDSA